MKDDTNDTRAEIERLRFSLGEATREIGRLHDVIGRHVEPASRIVVSNYLVEVETVISDYSGMRTTVVCLPHVSQFFLSEQLASWSADHKEAFRKQVTSGFSNAAADDIAKSIFGAVNMP